MENDNNYHPYYKDISLVGTDTVIHHSRYKQTKRQK